MAANTQDIITGRLSKAMELAVKQRTAVYQLFQQSPGMERLMKNSMEIGGEGLQQPIVVKEMEIASYNPGGDYGVGVPDILENAKWAVKDFSIDVSLPKTKVDRSKSPEAMVNLVKTYRDTAMKSFMKGMWKMFLGHSIPGATTQIASFPDIANIDRSYGGIDSTTVTAWDGYRLNATTSAEWGNTVLIPTDDWIANNLFVQLLDYVISDVSYDGPFNSATTIFVGKIIWNICSAIAQNAYSPIKIDGTERWGPNSFIHRGVEIVFDKEIDDSKGYMYIVNFNYLDFVFSEGYKFKFEGYTREPRSDMYVGYILTSGELICTAPRYQGLVTGLPTVWEAP